MSEGGAARAVLWSLLVATVLLAWPWLLAGTRRRWPRSWPRVPATPWPDLQQTLGTVGRPRGAVIAAWIALVTTATALPLARGLQAADLDAGLLWLLALAAMVLPWHRRLTPGATAATVVAVGLAVLPPVLHTASGNLADVVVAQQGGVGNWFLLRDPFQLLTGMVLLLTIAVTWPPPSAAPCGLDGWLDAAVRAGLPLVLAHLLVVIFLGGWWGVAPWLDDLGALNSLLKIALVLAAALTLRPRVTWLRPASVPWVLPLTALLGLVGSACWMTAVGAAW
jgi:hypothetical protein